jgi:YD repeat-containing protein
MGLIWGYEERQLPGPVPKTRIIYSWTTDPAGNPYISSVTTSLDPDTENQVQKKLDQTKDAYGNVTQTKLYEWNSLTTPARTYTNTYSTDSNYTSRYIRNRLLSSTLTSGSQTITLVTNTYDGSTITDPGGMREHDAAYSTGFLYRGNVTRRVDLVGTTTLAYDVGGNAVSVTAPGGVAVSGSYQSSTNFATPSSITTNTLADTLQWSAFLGLTEKTGPNGDNASTVYDAYARPSSTTAPTGAVTTYTYSATAPHETATVNGRWTRKTLDGLGRPLLVETGNGSAVVSQTDVVYDSCACSPIGKLKKQSLPHAQGGVVNWVIYNYDGLGRTVSVVQPDGSAKTYEYLANTVKVTDEAGKWKKYTMDAFGNLTQVLEPDPESSTGATYTTTYTYDQLNHLTTVTMPRPSGTQTRTFNYGTPPGAFLVSATNPENGTVAYTYGGGGVLTTKTDAKNQQIRYAYDSYLRLTRMSYYQTPASQEDTQARVDIYYDTDYNGHTDRYTLGRMTWKQYTVNTSDPGCLPYNCTPVYTFRELYGYTQPGQLNNRSLNIDNGITSTALSQIWNYDNEGRVTMVRYPTAALNQDGSNGRDQWYSYGYDAMGRLASMQYSVWPNTPTNVVTGVTYGPADEPLTISMVGRAAETRTYNSLLQLTGLNESTFAYPAGQNNGRIQSETNTATGEQITYQYDALNRLISAVTSDNPNVTQWGQQFVYDGFGNLREKNVIKGSAPTLSVLISAATNRVGLWQYDVNGNQLTTNTQTLTYDYDNRVAKATSGSNSWSRYWYDPDGRRVYTREQTDPNPLNIKERIYIYGLGGEILGSYTLKYSGSWMYTVYEGHSGYFGGRLIEKGTNNSSGVYTILPVTMNRLGSVGKNYPYGENGGTDGVFATYTRDSGGLDYAQHRYYYSITGRSMTPDPSGLNAVNLKNTVSWNAPSGEFVGKSVARRAVEYAPKRLLARVS